MRDKIIEAQKSLEQKRREMHAAEELVAEAIWAEAPQELKNIAHTVARTYHHGWGGLEDSFVMTHTLADIEDAIVPGPAGKGITGPSLRMHDRIAVYSHITVTGRIGIEVNWYIYGPPGHLNAYIWVSRPSGQELRIDLDYTGGEWTISPPPYWESSQGGRRQWHERHQCALGEALSIFGVAAPGQDPDYATDFERASGLLGAVLPNETDNEI